MKVRVESRGLPFRSISRIAAFARTLFSRRNSLTLLLLSGTSTFFWRLPSIENFLEPRRATRRLPFFLRAFFEAPFLAALLILIGLAVVIVIEPEQARGPAHVSRTGTNLPLTSFTER